MARVSLPGPIPERWPRALAGGRATRRGAAAWPATEIPQPPRQRGSDEQRMKEADAGAGLDGVEGLGLQHTIAELQQEVLDHL